MTRRGRGRGLAREDAGLARDGTRRAGFARDARVLRAAAIVGVSFAAGLAACSSSDGSSPDDAPRGDGGAQSLEAPRWADLEGSRQAALPTQTSAKTALFSTSDVCAQCHGAGDDEALRDARGRDVSPVGTWKTSAMAMAARDPFYLAVFADEVIAKPAQNLAIQGTCTRCHAPEGHVEMGAFGVVPTFGTLTTSSDTSNEAAVAREGVACTLCHQIASSGLGSASSFSGGFEIGDERRIFGPYPDPVTDPMRLIVNYTPTHAPSIQSSSLCATCHTVLTNARDDAGKTGPTFPEQVPYLEWLASAYTTEPTPGEKAATCQECHMPAVDDDGNALELPIARVDGLRARTPFRRHGFAGGNVFLSRLAATDPAWIGLPLTSDDHLRQAAANEAMLRLAATVAIDPVRREGQGIVIDVRVENTAGHKFPTGYPSRRAFLHVQVEAAGRVLFESGRTDAWGRLIDGAGTTVEPVEYLPHFTTIDREDQVQIYESVPVDGSGKVVHRPLDAHRYAKDNRLLPAGFNRRNAYSAFTAPVGVDEDADWSSSDVVSYRIAGVPSGAQVRVTLEYQTARPSELDALARAPSAAARRLFDFAKAARPTPVVVASATGSVP